LAPRLGAQQPATNRTLAVAEVVAIQCTLDAAGFSPGLVDGRWGGLTRQALAAWQQAQGLPATGEFDQATALQFPASAGAYTNHVVTAADVAALGHAPQDWRERAEQPRLAFETLRELLAERYHTKEDFLIVLNQGITDWSTLKEGDTIRVPNTMPEAAHAAVHVARLKVSLGRKVIVAYDDAGRPVGLFPCSIAASQEKRPVGTLAVESIALDPNYTFDPVNFPELDDQQKGYGKLVVPPGPNNPVGTAWIGLSKPGYGIHGTPHPEQIGKTESHGCFRLANWNATRLAHLVVAGTPVEVTLE
jgi:lipoprotein-anchoring transpeptidase ErfK/SrfK